MVYVYWGTYADLRFWNPDISPSGLKGGNGGQIWGPDLGVRTGDDVQLKLYFVAENFFGFMNDISWQFYCLRNENARDISDTDLLWNLFYSNFISQTISKLHTPLISDNTTVDEQYT